MCELTDEALATRGCDGISVLVERYYRYVRTIIVRRVCDSEIADELTQEVFLRVAQGVQNFESRGNGSFKAWISRIAMLVLYEYFRKAKRDVGTVDELNPADPLSEPRDPVFALIDEAMQSLSIEDQDILKRQHWRKQSYQQIANDYGVTVHVVKERLRVAKRNLKTAIDRIRREQDGTSDT